jgi:hypothetical protein
MKIALLLVGLQAYCSCRPSFAFFVHNAPQIRQHGTTAPSQLYATETAVSATIDNPRQTGLALMLDDGTRKSHSMAQNTQFVTVIDHQSLLRLQKHGRGNGQHCRASCASTGLSRIASATTTEEGYGVLLRKQCECLLIDINLLY